MRVSKAFPVNLPIERIDMYRWATEMTPADYESFAPAHKAMGRYSRGPDFLMVNVELIGTDLIVQRYALIEHSKAHVKFYSDRTTCYIYRWVPVTIGVPWEMMLRPTSDRTCELVCTIGADFSSRLLSVVAWANGLGSHFLRRHLAVEGAAFALDIERRFGAGATAAPRIADQLGQGQVARKRSGAICTKQLSSGVGLAEARCGTAPDAKHQ